MINIGIVIPYFGKGWPAWIDYFLLSCKYNPSIDWHFFTDCGKVEGSGGNLYFHNMSLDDFNRLASSKLKLTINIKNPYKLCDFKPAYGKIFEEYLGSYDFWGYGDLDLVYGDIRKYYSDDLLRTVEILSAHDDFVTGHLCLLKNSEKIKLLFMSGGYYQKAFTTNNYIGFDEQLLTLKVLTQPFLFRLSYQLNLMYHLMIYKVFSSSLIKSVGKIGKRFVKTRDHIALFDFTSIVKKSTKEKRTTIYFETTHQSDVSYKKNNIKDWCVTWDKGILADNQSGGGMLYFHFMYSKAKSRFSVDQVKGPVEIFTIQKNGINITE